jgi:hypothetical protein
LACLIALATKNDLAAAMCDLTKVRFGGGRPNVESALVVGLGHRAIARPSEICRLLPQMLPRADLGLLLSAGF